MHSKTARLIFQKKHAQRIKTTRTTGVVLQHEACTYNQDVLLYWTAAPCAGALYDNEGNSK